MARIRIVTDSASDLPEVDARRLDVDVVSLTVRFGEEEFTDRVDLTADTFWAKCKSAAKLPETAAPSPGAFAAAYKRAREEGCDGVLVLALSEALSATHQSAVLGAAEVPDFDVRVIDTRAVSMAQGLLVIEAAELAANGADIDQIEQRVLALREKVGVVATLDTLEHLIKGGRIGGAKALVGQVLSIKPLIELRDGVVAEAGRARTRAKALSALAERAQSHAPLRRMALLHGASEDRDKMAALLAAIPTEFPLMVTDIGPVVGTHGGPGIIGVAWLSA